MYPTFLELAGIKNSNRIDGIPIVKTLLREPGQEHHNYLYWEFHENDGTQAVRWNYWKGVRLGVNKNANAPIELYDLSEDPSETKNVADHHPDIVKKINELMKEAHVQNMDWPLLASEFIKQ